MAGDLRGFALEKAELLSSRLKDLLTSGEAYVRTHFGVDLGLRAELYPPWVILSTAAAGLLLLLAVSCAAVCSGLLGGKKRRTLVTTQSNTEPDMSLLSKNNAKTEELKKKNKKKSAEKNQSNGQPVSVAQVQATEKLSPKSKAEKVHEVQAPAQVKKNKKKTKPDVKPAHQASTAEGREPDDGAWETKVSNREKRQQRKKERGPDDSGSPGGEAPKTHLEGPGVKTSKKNKGNRDSQPSRSSGKGDASGAASTSWSEEASGNGGGWIDMSLKMSSQMGSMEGPKWSTIPTTQPWTQETQAAWSGIESRINNDLNPVSFSMLRLSVAEPAANSIELQWTNQKDAEDEWSGFNGMATVDPSSDWNAPVEHWGNYEEPSVLLKAAFSLKEQPGINKLSEDEKDGEDPSEGAAKSRSKRRKKKKTEEETLSTSQMESSTPLIQRQELPVQASHKSSVSSTQKKHEETTEPPKPTQKKKVRRET